MQPAWRLHLFGEVCLRGGGVTVSNFQTKRAAKLLVLLALSRTGSMRRDDLADLLWPDDYLDSTRLRLRQELARLRKALGDAADLFSSNQEWVSLATGQIETDLQALRRPHLEDSDEFRRMLSEPFLPGWDDVWVMPERARADELRVSVASRISSDLIETRNPQAALEIAQCASKIDPQREDLRLLAMKAYTALGSLTDALTEYRRFTRETGTALAEPVLRSEAVKQPDSVPTGIKLPLVPHPIDQLFGREEVLDRLGKLITDAPEVRLISVVGPGGIGKSRLAIEAFRKTGREEGFISFVECGESSDPIAFLQEQLVPGHRFGDPIQVLIELIGHSETFLILDNLEHLNDPGVFVNRLLQALPRLRIVVTSRRPMKVSGERTISLGPLDRTAEALPMLEHLCGSRAVELSEIVERCDGMPLTLRLAAARLRFLEPAELVQELASDDALRANLPDLPERQRDLSMLLKLSCDDLSEEDAAALLKISVFPGGVTRALAKGFLGEAVDDTLEHLLDAALVWLDDERSPLRFKMLEPVRQFVQRGATSQQMESAETELVRQVVRATDAFYPAYALTPRPDRTLYRQESANLRRALEIAVERQLPETTILLDRLWHHELSAGHRKELVDLSNACLALPEPNPARTGFAHLALAWCCSAEGRLDDAAEHGLLSEESFLEAGDEPNACYARLTIDEHLRYKSSPDVIEARYEALLERCEKAVPAFLYMVRGWRGLTRTYRQDWEGSGSDLEFAYDHCKSAELLDMVLTAGIGLLLVDHARGNHTRRRERLEEIRKAALELDDHHHWSVVQRAEARFALVDGDFESAERHARRGLGIFGYSGNVLHETEIKVSLARALIGQGRLDEARETIRETAAAVNRQLRRVGVVSLAALAELCFAQGNLEQAQFHLGHAIAYRDAFEVNVPNVEAEYIAELMTKISPVAPADSVSDDVAAALLSGA